jgi:transposase
VTLLTPFAAQLQALLAQDPERSAVNCLQHLRAAGYRGGITTLRGHLARLRPAPTREAFVPLTFAPAERVQIDWGEFGDVFGIGRAVHAFLLVCCYSRWLTVEFTFSQSLEAFLRCHEHAFALLGGYSREAQYDNLASAVAERRGRLVRWNPRFLAYAGHCGFRPVACTPGRGNEKGRVEDTVKFLRGNFWPGRTFRDLADLNAQAQAWRDAIANQREHRVTRKIPSLLVAEERPQLLPLREPYDTDEVRSVLVPPAFRIAFDSNRYSVPWRLVGKALTLRADAATVTLWYGTHRVARHPRGWGRDREIVCPAHAEGLLAQKPGAQGAWQVQAVEQLGPHAQQYLTLIRAGTRSLRAELEHLLLLTTLYGPAHVEAALGACLVQAIVGSDHVERWLTLQQAHPVAPPPLTLGDPRLTVPPVRPNLQRYDALLVDPDGAADPQEAPDAPTDA